MENKINISKLLEDCPSGMELDCPIFENLEFDRIDKNSRPYSIICRVKREWGGYNVHTFTEYGCYSTEKYSKCAIFPKGKTTWEGFQRPFKDGEVVVCDVPYREHPQMFIFKEKKENNTLSTCYLMVNGDELDLGESSYYVTRLATKEERQRLFQVIKDNNYHWNAETKTLEKLIEPKFKVWDKVQLKKDICEKRIIDNVLNNCYTVQGYGVILFTDQDEWELVPNKFDIPTLKPFDNVLVRDFDTQEWSASLFSHCNGLKRYKYTCMNGSGFKQCIPYEGNEHLLGTTNDCSEYYKTWEDDTN